MIKMLNNNEKVEKAEYFKNTEEEIVKQQKYCKEGERFDISRERKRGRGDTGILENNRR